MALGLNADLQRQLPESRFCAQSTAPDAIISPLHRARESTHDTFVKMALIYAVPGQD